MNDVHLQLLRNVSVERGQWLKQGMQRFDIPYLLDGLGVFKISYFGVK